MTETAYTPRATSMTEMRAVMEPLLTPEGIGKGLAFQPRPDDVIIAPYGKSGTTWLQQIVHGLRTGGDMDFDDISRVVPWIETAADLGLDLEAEQRALPRAFKSHLSYDAVPKGCRYIVSLRDPKDAAVSLYRFFENWFFEPGTITLDEFVRARVFPDGTSNPEGSDYWSHFISWWEQKDNPNVLLLAYENMQKDPVKTITRIADFIGVPLSSDLLAVVKEQSSIEFMLAHKDRFDDYLMRKRSEEVAGLPPGDSAKVRSGKVDSHKVEMGEELIAELDAIWARTIATELELPSYAAVVEAL